MVRRPDQPPENPPEIRVFLVDDHPIVRMGVRDLLEAEPDIKVIGEAGTASSALARIPAVKPDVAVLDVRLPDGDGVAVCRELRSRLPRLACLMLTSFGDDEALFDAVMAGAAGYVLKQIRGTDLVDAVYLGGRRYGTGRQSAAVVITVLFTVFGAFLLLRGIGRRRRYRLLERSSKVELGGFEPPTS